MGYTSTTMLYIYFKNLAAAYYTVRLTRPLATSVAVIKRVRNGLKYQVNPVDPFLSFRHN